MPRPSQNFKIRKRKTSGLTKAGAALGALGTIAGTVGKVRREKRERRRAEEEATRKREAEERQQRIANRRAEAKAARDAAKLELDLEKFQEQKFQDQFSRAQAIRAGELEERRVKVLERPKVPGTGTPRRPLEFELRSERIRSLLTDDIEESPFRFGFESIARAVGNDGVDIKSVEFQKTLLDKIKENFSEEEQIDRFAIADYMLRNADKLPWTIREGDPEVEKVRMTMFERAGLLFKHLTGGFKREQKALSARARELAESRIPQSADELIEQEFERRGIGR
jgi:hypothetical protein